MRISEWSSDLCSSDLSCHASEVAARRLFGQTDRLEHDPLIIVARGLQIRARQAERQPRIACLRSAHRRLAPVATRKVKGHRWTILHACTNARHPRQTASCYKYMRSEEHTSELQSLLRISYADFCLKQTKKQITNIILLHQLLSSTKHK